MALAFGRDRRTLRELLPAALEGLPAGGALWLCWPKKSSGVTSPRRVVVRVKDRARWR